jgi:hypothetical protein
VDIVGLDSGDGLHDLEPADRVGAQGRPTGRLSCLDAGCIGGSAGPLGARLPRTRLARCATCSGRRAAPRRGANTACCCPIFSYNEF